MSVPGLQLTELNQASETVFTRKLAPENEWRFEVAHNESLEVKILSGTAEIYGTELALGHKYTFRGTKSAIFTWHGCVLEARGPPSVVEYTAEETPTMTAYTNLHFALEKQRGRVAEESQQQQYNRAPIPGPRVLIVGPVDSGKTTLTKILTGYAIRHGRKPCVVNLDPREGVLSLPGTLTATTFSTIMDVEDGWGSSPTSGPSAVPVKLPLVYYYGFPTPDANPRLYKKLTSRLALAVASRLGEDREAQFSGVVVDTPSTISADMIHHLVADFGISVLVVVGSERLYSDMARKYPSQFQTSSTPTSTTTPIVIKLAKSGGCVDRPASFLQQSRNHAVKSYFFGEEPKRTLSPYTMTVDYTAVKIFRLIDVEGARGNTSLLPGGGLEDEDAVVSGVPQVRLLERVDEPSRMLMNSVLAVLACDVNEPLGAMVEASVVGFVYVVDVEEPKRRMKILAPVAGRLPNRPLVVGYFPEATVNLVG
ncbi:Pre-mRNA cleavage complex II protein Clp1-domain-containing protein [Peziza echinospora]|nr:Pre-mRNA cleavage complex II protein Clp1-domain-containing protein [Peziza echinospora]